MRYLQFNPEHSVSDYWDMTLVKDLLGDLPDNLLVIPGAYQADYIADINRAIGRTDNPVVIVSSDEEAKFPVGNLAVSLRVPYVMYYDAAKHGQAKPFPIGYSPDTRKLLQLADKDLDVFFAGQVNHASRVDMIEHIQTLLEKYDTLRGYIYTTQAFASGLSHQDYYHYLARAKVVPCPAGNISPDSFRLYEALEAAAVPVAQNPAYFKHLFGAAPFPVVEKSEQWLGYIWDCIQQYPVINNRVFAWWQKYKRDLRNQFIMLCDMATQNSITVIIPSSPIKSHPSTAIIEETVASVRAQLPDNEIIITLDGVRPEQEARRIDYEEYKRHLLWLCNHSWRNVVPIVFETHQHQSGMMRHLLDHNEVKTPLLLYVEADCPLTPDRTIEWDKVSQAIVGGNADLIRFHFEAAIPEPHRHLMLDNVPKMVHGVPLLRTTQWSQRPHLASVAYYRRIFDNYFSKDANAFIEDRMYGVTQEAYARDGKAGWFAHRQWIYYPNGDIKRSYTLDGRAGEHKYDDRQVY